MPPAHLYDQIATNKRASWVLMAAVSLIFAATGAVIGAVWFSWQGGLILGVGVASIMALISFTAGDQIILASMGAREADPEQFKQLHNIVEEMAIAGGLPKPKVCVIHSDASNAFAAGRNPEHASVTVTTGIMDILNREELQGVIGHEMSHVRNYDVLYGTVMAVMVGSIALLCDLFMRSLWFGSPRRRSSSDRDSNGAGGALVILALVFAILAPIVAGIIQMAMSRRREYLADEGSTQLTRNPIGLAHALEKIAGDPDPLKIKNRGAQHLFIINPLKPMGANGWLSTHPPIQERIQRLRELAHEIQPGA